MTSKPERHAVLVLGMHRSGTSALTRVLNMLGLDLPKTIAGASEGNETGHWESHKLNALDDSILDELGLKWFSWNAVNTDQLGAKRKQEIIDEIAAMLRLEYPGNNDFVIKDPRICRIPDLYLDALKDNDCDYSIVLPIRNPLEVADSLFKRDNLSTGQAAMLWLRYVLDAEFVTRKLNRVFISYEDFLSDWKSCVETISTSLTVKFENAVDDMAAEIDRFISPKLRHNVHTPEDVILDTVARGWVSRTYDALRMLTSKPGNKKALADLDSVRSEMDNATPLLEHMLNSLHADHIEDVEDKNKVIQNLDTTISEKTAHILELETLSKENSAKLEVLEKSSQETSAKFEEMLQTLTQERDQLVEQLTQLQGETTQIEGTLKQRNQELAEKSDTIKTLESHATQAQKHIGVLEAEIAKLTHDLSQTGTELQAAEARTVKLAGDLALEREQSQALSESLGQTEFALNSANHQKNSLYTQLTQLEKKSTTMADDVSGLSQEIQRLQTELVQEKRTVLRPAIRRLRSFTGRSLRAVLPNRVVDRMALMAPTAEQKHQIEIAKRADEQPRKLIQPADIHALTHQNDKPDVFILAIIGWHFRIQRPQHIARALTEQGHRVFYFEMDLPGKETEIEQIDHGLFRIKLKLKDVEQIPAYVGTPTAEQEKSWLKGFYQFCDQVNATAHKEMIIQHPFWWQLARLLPPEFRTLYDCMDDIAGFDNSTQELIDLEYAFLEGVDDLVVSSITLFEKYKNYNPKDLIRNATEIDHFQSPDLSALTEEFKAKKLSKSSKPIKIGYVGAIADWYDADMLRAAAHTRSDFEFHLCGNVSADTPRMLGKEPNIHMYGEIPYTQVPAFLSQMDVLIIPFRILPIIRACDPVKFYEYCALGKPTVSTKLPELERAKHLVFFASTSQEFCQKVDEAYTAKDDQNFITSLKEFAAQNTWAQRGLQFENVINHHPKVTIVILAYGDPELTNAALHSLKRGGDIYPNMEILIVDNGSPTEAIENIRTYAGQFEDVTIIENGDNLGFAGGNNVGLEAATGDYVLLLNNDTYVSPGSVYAMAQHLKDNPDVGAVGPLTNNIGNEAKVFVDYESMSDMIKTSRAFKTGYRGKHFETAVVAYFAVMFRKSDIAKFGLLSSDYGRGMFEDDDHCAVIRSQDYKCVVAEDAYVHHHLSATFSKIDSGERNALFEKNKAVFEAKWGEWIPHKYRDARLESDLKFPNDDLI